MDRNLKRKFQNKFFLSILIFFFLFGQSIWAKAPVSKKNQEVPKEQSLASNPDAKEVKAKSQSKGGEKYTLDQCIDLTLKQKNLEWHYQIEAFRGDIIRATWSALPTIQIQELFGPIPNKEWDEVGILNRVKLTAGYPVYDFGRTKNYRTAATERLRVEQKETEKAALSEIVEVVQLYYGLLFARESLNILNDAHEKVDNYRQQIEKKYKKRSGSFTRADLLNMSYEVLKIEREISRTSMELNNAFNALALKMGFDSQPDFDIEDRFLKPLPYDLKKLEEYQKLAVNKRPEIAMLDSGIEARKSLVTAEKMGFLPAFFVGGFVENGVTTQRTDNTDLNFTEGGIGLALNWDFDFNKTKGKMQSANSEYQKLLQQKRLALPAIQLDVTRAYREAERTKEDVERNRKARKIGRALMFFAKSNWDIGVGDSVKLKDALIRFNEARFNHMKSIFDFNVAVAKLSQAVGSELEISTVH